MSLSSSSGETRTSWAGWVILTTGGRLRVTLATISVASLLARPSRSTSSTLKPPRVGKREGRAGRRACHLRPGVSAIAWPSASTSWAVATSLLRRQSKRQLGPLDGRDMADVLDGLGLERRVARENQLGVGALELGVFEHVDLKASVLLPSKFDAIGQVGVDRLDVAGEGGSSRLRVMPRGAAGWALSSTTRLASAGTPPLKRATTRSDVPRSISVLPGSTCDVAGAGTRQRSRRARFGVRPGLADQGDRHGDQATQGSRHGPVAMPRSFQVGHGFVPVVGAAMVERLADHGDCRKPSAADGVSRVFLDRGEQPGTQLGMFRLDPPGHPAGVAHRPQGGDAQPTPVADDGRERQPAASPSETSSCARARFHHPDRRADQAQASQQSASADQSRTLPEAPRDLFQCSSQFRGHVVKASARIERGRSSVRPASQVSRIRMPIAARISQRQSFWRPSSSALYICRRCFAVDRLPGHGSPDERRTLLDRLDGQRRGLALERIKIDGERRCAPPACRPCRRRVDRWRQRCACGERSSRSLRPACDDHALDRLIAGGKRHRLADAHDWPTTPAAASDSSKADISGTNFDDRASWLSAGCQPLARTTSLPLPSVFSITAASLFSNRASTRDSPSRLGVDAPIFPEADLGEIVELGPGQRGEQRMVEGDLAEHHVTARPPPPRCSQGDTPASAASVSARPGAVAT